MKPGISTHRDARVEFREALLYYRNADIAVATEFFAFYERAVEQIIAAPLSNPQVVGTIRRKLLSKYPFSIFYRFSGERPRILAIAHHKRKPHYWLGRS